jgi:hypothetical protein
MATLYSPKLPTENMSLCLDVSNTKSYPGSGTVWSDLCNNLTFTSYGTTTPVEIVSGSKSFAFNGSGYWYCSTNYSLVDFGGDCTLVMWIFNEGVSTRRTIFEKNGTIYSSYQQELAVTWEPANHMSWYSRYTASYDYGNTEPLVLGKWNMVGIQMSTGKSATARTGLRSLNGSAWQSGYYVSNSNTALVAAGPISIGTGYTGGAVQEGNISMAVAYNKMLSNSEILQFYNATKTRFVL